MQYVEQVDFGVLNTRICIISSGFSSIYGGVEKVIFTLSELWANNGHEVCIISGRGKKTGPRGVRLIKLPFIPRKYFIKIPLLTKILPDHELEGFSLLPFALLCLAGVGSDIVLSNQIGETYPALILGKPSIMISQAPNKLRLGTFRHATRVIVETPLSQGIIRKYGIETDVILYGANMSKHPAANVGQLRLNYGISDNSIIILTVARLVPDKRINLLIDAFKLIKQEAALIIIGDGSEIASLKKQAYSTKSENKIIFVKPMSPNELTEFYQLCDVFTLPSIYEPFGIVFVEALGFGKIVVTNPEPESTKKFILDKFGVYTDVTDPIEYSESLLRAVSMKIDVSSADYIQHMRKFNWDEIALQYEKIFHEVLQERHSS